MAHSRLACAISSDALRRQQPSHRSHADDGSTVLSHPRIMHMLDPGNDRYDVDVEDLAHGTQVDVKKVAHCRIDCSIVDEHVDGSKRRDCLGNGLCLMPRVVGLPWNCQYSLTPAKLLRGLLECIP